MPGDYVKSSFASVLPMPNASTASKSSQYDPFDIIQPCNTVGVDHVPYTISDLVMLDCNDHDSVKTAMQQWLRSNRNMRVLTAGGTTTRPTIVVEKGLGEMGHNQLWLMQTHRDHCLCSV